MMPFNPETALSKLSFYSRVGRAASRSNPATPPPKPFSESLADDSIPASYVRSPLNAYVRTLRPSDAALLAAARRQFQPDFYAAPDRNAYGSSTRAAVQKKMIIATLVLTWAAPKNRRMMFHHNSESFRMRQNFILHNHLCDYHPAPGNKPRAKEL